MTQKIQEIAKSVNGLIGTGSLNWMGDFNMQTKKHQFNLFFHKETEAKKAVQKLAVMQPKMLKTPRFVNVYFKYSITISY